MGSWIPSILKHLCSNGFLGHTIDHSQDTTTELTAGKSIICIM
uniref:Uncharacterized protein n=1 Tax=Arundo donax TaxID=35708 RepID=A0A0A9AWV0_ARUDO